MEEEFKACCVSVYMLQSFKRKPFSWGRARDNYARSGNILCGSEAELYIKPIHSCVDDIDYLREEFCALAFHDSVPLLPVYVRNLHEYISCFRIEPCNSYPAFVRLRVMGIMKYIWDQKKYEFFRAPAMHRNVIRPIPKNNLANYENYLTTEMKGPAIRSILSFDNGLFDHVPSVRSPQWPKEASNWPTRPRKHSWPTKAIMLEIVRRGCHIVYVQHRDCRDDESQWRLSFSVAEVLLLRSWTPIQQIVYHMLRFFAKKKLIKKDCPKEKEVLCTYHFKTLMLWACEQESPEWWESTLLIHLCCQLLQKLSEWLWERCCPNYFIPEANLFYKNTDLDSHKAIAERINYFCDSNFMSQWFLRNYILSYHCKSTGGEKQVPSPSQILEFANQFSTEQKSLELESFDLDLRTIHETYIDHVGQLNLEVIIGREMIEYANARIRSPDVTIQLQSPTRKEINYFEAVLLMLTSPNALSCGKATFCSNLISDVLRLMSLRFAPDWWFHYHNFPENYESQFEKSFVYFLKAQECLGNLYARLSPTEFELRCRMSMEFLRKSITCKDSSYDSVRCAVVVYAAAICYANSQYQTAYDLCSTVLTDPWPASASHRKSLISEPLNAGCLLFIEDVARIVGFLVLCKHVHESTMANYRQFDLDLRISPDVFAQYILLQSMEGMAKLSKLNGGVIGTLFLFDTLLLAKMKNKISIFGCFTNSHLISRRLCVYRRNDSINELVEGVTGFAINEDICVPLLIECSLEKMTCLYQAVFEKFDVQEKTVVSCYRALYLYKSRKYDEALNLCEEVLRESELAVDLEYFLVFSLIMVYPPLLPYFDEDIQCIIGLQLIEHFLFLSNVESVSHIITANDLYFGRTSHDTAIRVVLKKILSKRHFRFQYILRKHFVARYVKLRCLIDCKSSVSLINRAFGELKSKLPLEHLVHQFLFQKLQGIIDCSKFRKYSFDFCYPRGVYRLQGCECCR